MMLFLARAHRFFFVSAVDRRLFLTAAALITLSSIALRICRFSTLWRFFEYARLLYNRRTQRQPALSPDQISKAVARAGRYVPDATCLSLALAGAALLNWHGHQANLCIGVAKSEGVFGAHAWVEGDDPTFLIGSQEHFTKLLAYPSAIS
jgi:hypothetical protein